MKKSIEVIMAIATVLLTYNIGSAANVAIYVWSGANSEHLLALFRSVEAMDHTPYGINSYDIIHDRLTTGNFHVLILPAGEDGKPDGYNVAFTSTMKSKVGSFVSTGGGFVGIEAGAYFASNNYSSGLNLYTGSYTATSPTPGLQTFSIVGTGFGGGFQDAFMSDGGGTFSGGTTVVTNSSGDPVAVSDTTNGRVILTAMDLSLRADDETGLLDWTIWDNWEAGGTHPNSEDAWKLLGRMIDWADGDDTPEPPTITSSNPSGGQKVAVMSTHNINGGAFPGLIPAVGKSISNAGHIPLAIRGVDINTAPAVGCPPAITTTSRLTFPYFTAVVFPGGNAWGYFYGCDALQNGGMSNVRNFVTDGGGLLGLCAGAYLGADKIVWKGNTGTGTHNYDPTVWPFYDYPMDLYDGSGATELTDTGPHNAIATFDVGGVFAWAPTDTTIDDDVLGFNSGTQKHFYYGGGAKTNLASDVVSVATYDALSGQINAVRFKRGMGHVLLVGTHPEARSDMADWLYWNNYKYDSSSPIDTYNGWGFIGAALNRWLLPAEKGNSVAEIVGTWSSGIWYWDVATSEWTNMTSYVTNKDIAAGDFNGDGKTDVASNWSSGLWWQDGATLGWTQVYHTAPDRITAGDITGDSVDEIIGCGGGWDLGIWVYDIAKSSWTQINPNTPIGDITAGDFNGDGKTDVAATWDSGLWWQDVAAGSAYHVYSANPYRLTAGDITGDGADELISTWSSGFWYYDVAGSSWTQMTSYATQQDIAAGDFTGDGIDDVASIWSSGLWYQNGATLSWTNVTSWAPYTVTAGDVTGK